MDFSVFKNKYFIEGELTVQTALHIGSGKEADGHDAPFITVDEDFKNGNFYIPGSSFRGYMRTKLEKFLIPENNFKFKDKETNEHLNMADVLLIFGYTNLFSENNSDLFTKNNSEIIERMEKKLNFTSKEKENFSSMAGKIHISDMQVISDVNSIRRDGIKINKDTGSTLDGAKFDYDVVPAGTKFKFVAEIENIEPYQLDLVALSLKDIYEEGDLFGGKLSRGIGKCKLENLKIYYVDSSDKNKLRDYIFKNKKSSMKDEKDFFKLENLDLDD